MQHCSGSVTVLSKFDYNIHRFGYTHLPETAEFYPIKITKQ